jgi:DNA-binding transcriptional regulator LsrR (DeoR family)
VTLTVSKKENKMSYKRYPAEFMEEADRAKIANNLGVKYKTLSTWVTKAMSKPSQNVKIDYQSC